MGTAKNDLSMKVQFIKDKLAVLREENKTNSYRANRLVVDVDALRVRVGAIEDESRNMPQDVLA